MSEARKPQNASPGRTLPVDLGEGTFELIPGDLLVLTHEGKLLGATVKATSRYVWDGKTLRLESK